jgi:chemotaxis protein methyltransferase CheR
MAISIPENLKTSFKNIIKERTGLYFKDYTLKDLEGAILQRMDLRKLDSPVSYFNILSLSEEKEDEFRELLNILTVNHTYFFRNEPQFLILNKRILPEIIDRKLRSSPKGIRPSLRIWSAGCSTGEEPYTLAMLVNRSIPDLENWDIQILATDASQAVLSQARKGIYSENSVRHIPKDYLDSYFRLEQAGTNTRYVISDIIKNMVEFAYFNLMDADYPQGFDIIFCRNVVIYFEIETTIAVMNKFHNSLDEKGYLFIGYSETLQFLQKKFKMFIQDDAVYYRSQPPGSPPERNLPVKEEDGIDKFLEEISRKQAAAELEAELKKTTPSRKLEEVMSEAIKAFRMKDYDQALALTEEAHSVDKKALDPYYIAAEINLSRGRFQEAREKLSRALKINPMFAAAYYLMGCICLEEGDIPGTKQNLKKSMYIDGGFVLAHFYIAQAFKNEGRVDEAIREYRNASKLLASIDSQGIIPYSGGFNASTLMSVCRDNIERLKVGA